MRPWVPGREQSAGKMKRHFEEKHMQAVPLETRIVDVTAANIGEHPQAICFINPKHEHFRHKVDWLEQQFKNGLRIKLLYPAGEKRAVGFIEYVPGEFCWRPVRAEGYLFIHCLWTTGKQRQHKGLGALLIDEAEAAAQGMLGVCVLTSDKSFMARKDIFIKRGYRVAAASGNDQLLVKQFKAGPLPAFNRPREGLEKHKGLAIVYSRQCPWVARFVKEAEPILEKLKLAPAIVELKTPAQAQCAPSVYGVFNLVCDGRILADRYISTTRFLNILKEKGLGGVARPERKGKRKA
jgi:predicted Rdx family selenoprotein